MGKEPFAVYSYKNGQKILFCKLNIYSYINMNLIGLS